MGAILALKEILPGRTLQAEVQVGVARRDPAPRGSLHKALLNQEWFIDIFDGIAFLADRRGEAVDSNRAPVELFDHRHQQTAIHMIEAVDVHFEHVECTVGDLPCHDAVGLHFRIVPHPLQ